MKTVGVGSEFQAFICCVAFLIVHNVRRCETDFRLRRTIMFVAFDSVGNHAGHRPTTPSRPGWFYSSVPPRHCPSPLYRIGVLGQGLGRTGCPTLPRPGSFTLGRWFRPRPQCSFSFRVYPGSRRASTFNGPPGRVQAASIFLMRGLASASSKSSSRMRATAMPAQFAANTCSLPYKNSRSGVS
jgi:hypothetical protein